MNRKKTGIALIVLIILMMGLWSIYTRTAPVKRDSGYRILMGTFSHIVVVAQDNVTAKNCIEAAFDEQHKVDRLMSDYKPDSELSNLNRQADRNPVKVSPETFEVLEEAQRISDLSSGAFDVTVGPLVELWRHAADINTPPSEAEITEAKAKVGRQNLVLDPTHQTVFFKKAGMKLDLGGIAKGYAIDLSIAALKQNGALGGMVDIGGDIRCFGKPPQRRKTWHIGLQDPGKADRPNINQSRLELNITDQAVATSGNYRRFSLIDGQKINHIIEPHQGYSSMALASVTIIADTAITADALATAVSVMGHDKGLALIETLPGIEAIVIDNDNISLTQTSGADAFIAR